MLTKDDPPLTLAQKRNSSFVWTGGEVSRHGITAIWVAFFLKMAAVSLRTGIRRAADRDVRAAVQHGECIVTT